MTFEQALKAMREGKEVIRPNYISEDGTAVLGVDFINITTTNSSRSRERIYVYRTSDSARIRRDVRLGSDDIVADDWEIYEDKPENETIGETTERLSKEYQNAIFESVQIAKNCILNAEFSEQYKKWENAHKSEDVEHLRADKVVLEHRIKALEKELTEKTAENHELRGQVKAYEHIISMLPWLATYDDDNGGD